MAKQNVARDYKEIPEFAKGYIGQTSREFIDAYAAKRKIATHRVGRAFWDLVDDGEIKTEKREDGHEVITEVRA